MLNNVKAIKRRRLDANIEKLKAILTTGSNLILQFSTATFKMAREGIRIIMDSIEQCRTKTVVTLTKKSDKENNIVEECYRVNRRTPGQSMCPTTSKILVNGKEVRAFIQKILPAVSATVKQERLK